MVIQMTDNVILFNTRKRMYCLQILRIRRKTINWWYRNDDCAAPGSVGVKKRQENDCARYIAVLAYVDDDSLQQSWYAYYSILHTAASNKMAGEEMVSDRN